MPPKKQKAPTKAEIEKELKQANATIQELEAQAKKDTKKSKKAAPDEAMASANKKLVKEISEIQSVLNTKTDELNTKMKASAESEKALIQKNIQLVNELKAARAVPVAAPQPPSAKSKNLIRDVSGNIYEAFPGCQQTSQIFQDEFLTRPTRRIKDIEFWIYENGQWVNRTRRK